MTLTDGRGTLEEALLLLASERSRLDALEQRVMDHEQRFDTLQTPYWKRVWFWMRWGWSLVDLNQERPSWRPWNRSRRAG